MVFVDKMPFFIIRSVSVSNILPPNIIYRLASMASGRPRRPVQYFPKGRPTKTATRTKIRLKRGR